MKVEERILLQFHYTAWSSHSCPFSNAILEFRRRVRKVVGNTLKSDRPMLVHCNDGGKINIEFPFFSSAYFMPYRKETLYIHFKSFLLLLLYTKLSRLHNIKCLLLFSFHSFFSFIYYNSTIFKEDVVEYLWLLMRILN